MTFERRLQVRSVCIEGVDAERLASTDREVRRVLSIFEKFDLDLVHDVVLTVILSHQMASHVDRIRREFGHKDEAPYNPSKISVAAGGITLCAPPRPPLDAAIVLDVKPWSSDRGEDVAVRIYSLSHEMGHVLQQARGNGAPWAEWEGRKRTHSGELRRTAAIVLDEFDADTCADAVCKVVLRNDREEPVSLDSIIGPGFIASARNLIERVAFFARNDVQSYRIAAVGLEGLYPRIGPLVGELLLVLTHATAIFAGSGNIVLLQEALELIPGFKEYFELDWDRFLSAVEGKQRDADETELARIAECILHRVGLRIEDMPDGSIYVHVHEPIVING